MILLLVPCLGLLLACSDSSPTAPSSPSSRPGAPGGPPSPPPSNGDIPTEVVGDWKAGTISMLGFWDNHTGDYVGATSGLAIFFTFEPNGEYSMLLYVLQRPLAWCVTQAWTELRGTVEFDGGTFVTNPTVGRYKASDNCSSEHNFDRAATTDELLDERRTYYWAFEPDEYGKTYMRIGFDLANRDAWNWFEQSD